MKLMVIAGEASGDLHAGNVLLELKRLRPDLEIVGTGGKIIASLAARIFYKVQDLAVIGLVDVLRNYGYYKGIFNSLLERLEEEKPDAVLLVDYPGFNLKFAREAKKRGFKVIYYIAPQVWIWKKNRIFEIKKYVDVLIALFPFEVDIFRAEKVETFCFGHPLLDIVKPSLDRGEVFERCNLDPDKKLVSFLPGSRRGEIFKHIPPILQTIESLKRKKPDLQFAMPLAPTVPRNNIEHYLPLGGSDNLRLVENDTYNLLTHSDFAAVASGTATLETALLETPLIIFYKSSIINYIIGKWLLNIDMIGLPNIVAGERFIPEEQRFASPEKMANAILFFLNNPHEYRKIRNNLVLIGNKLGVPGAYGRTAEFIDNLLRG